MNSDLEKEFEGCRLDSYQDQVGVWTIGYGHTKNVHANMRCTQRQADEWLMEDLQGAMADLVLSVKVEMTHGEQDALVDFIFNLGADNFNHSTLLRKLNAGDHDGAAEEFEKWDHAGGKVIAGLLRRRQAEKSVFNS